MKKRIPLRDLAITETVVDSLDECLVMWGNTRSNGMTLGELHAARYVLADKYALEQDMHSVDYFTGTYAGYTFGLSTSRHDKARIGAYMLEGLNDTMYEKEWSRYLGRFNKNNKSLPMLKSTGDKMGNKDFSVTFADGVTVNVDSSTEWGYAALDGAASGYSYEEFVAVFGPDPDGGSVVAPFADSPPAGTVADPVATTPTNPGMSPITMVLIGVAVFFVAKRFM